jgi:prepilin-type N-terminal cleavage/methylation domain-containing protein
MSARDKNQKNTGFIQHQFPPDMYIANAMVGKTNDHLHNYRKSIKIDAGFTILELLVVISIIGLLSSVMMIAVNNARVGARDAKRRDDSLAIRTALQWFYHENGYYPTPGDTSGNGNGNGNGQGQGNGNGNGNGNGKGQGNGNGNKNLTQGKDTAPDADIQNITGYLVPKYLQSMPNDPTDDPENYMYVWGNSGQDYAFYIPYGNEGEQSCKHMTPKGDSKWFGNAPICSYGQ